MPTVPNMVNPLLSETETTKLTDIEYRKQASRDDVLLRCGHCRPHFYYYDNNNVETRTISRHDCLHAALQWLVLYPVLVFIG